MTVVGQGWTSVLVARLPGTPAAIAAAERIPLRARSVDAVIGAQTFHWWDLERALMVADRPIAERRPPVSLKVDGDHEPMFG